MGTWLKRQWTDEAVFIGNVRFILFIVADLFANNRIKTKVDGLGPVIAAIIMAVAVKLNAGDKTPEIVKQVTADATGVPPEKQV